MESASVYLKSSLSLILFFYLLYLEGSALHIMSYEIILSFIVLDDKAFFVQRSELGFNRP